MPTAFVIHSRQRTTTATTTSLRMRDATAVPGQPALDLAAAAVIAGAARGAASFSGCSDSAKALRNRRSFRHGREVPAVTR
ncbi:hypothetical protein ACYX7E_01435 [Luteimonas sp. RIT-PG2_3]